MTNQTPAPSTDIIDRTNTRTGDRLADGSLVVNATGERSMTNTGWAATTSAPGSALTLDTFKVLDGWVLFEREDAIARVGMIHLVGRSDKERRYRPTPARVVQIGEPDQNKRGTFIKPQLKVGDRVALGRFAGHDIEIGGRLYVVATEDDVACVIGEDTKVSEVA